MESDQISRAHLGLCAGNMADMGEQDSGFLATKHSLSYAAKQKSGSLPSILALCQGMARDGL
jgi:hypothetical protein